MSIKSHSIIIIGFIVILTQAFAHSQERPLDQPLATSSLGTLTIGELQQFAQISAIPALKGVDIRNLAMMPPETLEEAAKYYMVRRAAQAELESTGTQALIDQHSQSMEAYLPNAYRTIFIRQEIESKRTVPTEQELRKYYDEHQVLFRQPFSFKMRHLIRLTYREYIVSSRDIQTNTPEDLKGIAEREMGNAELAENIREDTAGRPLRHDPDKMFKPLAPGETLLIPMNDEEAEKKKEELAGILAQMQNGQTFEQLAETYSEAESKAEVIGPLPSGTRPILYDFMKYAKSLEPGGVSEPFRTKHGWQVMELVERTEEGMKPFEAVKDRILKTLMEEEEKQLVEAALDTLFSDSGLKLEFEKIAKGNDLPDDEIVATVGDVKVPWREYKSSWQSRGYPTEPELIRHQARYVQRLQFALIERWAQRLIEQQGSPYAHMMEHIKTEHIGTSYLDTLTKTRILEELTEEKMREYYETHAEQFKQPEQVAFESIDMVITAGPEASPEERLAMQSALVEEMTRALAKIETKEDFISHASILNQALLARDLRPFRTEAPMNLSQVLPGIREEMENLEVGKWTEPIRYRDDHVISVLLTERIPERQLEFEEVQNQIGNALVEEIKLAMLEAQSQELLAKIDFQFVLEN